MKGLSELSSDYMNVSVDFRSLVVSNCNNCNDVRSNVYPDGYDAGEFHFRLYTFEQPTTCDVCKKLLR